MYIFISYLLFFFILKPNDFHYRSPVTTDSEISNIERASTGAYSGGLMSDGGGGGGGR